MSRSAAAVWVAVVGALLACGCTDLHLEALPTVGSGTGDVAVANPSFARDVQPIFTARCAVTGCHVTPTEANLRLVLTDEATSYGNLVNVPSVEFPSAVRVAPGSSATSYLMSKLDAGEMPKQGPMLSQGTRDTIRNWIDQGAARN
jgi:hypothetical protein